jgi:Tol biopolymer transport system component
MNVTNMSVISELRLAARGGACSGARAAVGLTAAVVASSALFTGIAAGAVRTSAATDQSHHAASALVTSDRLLSGSDGRFDVIDLGTDKETTIPTSLVLAGGALSPDGTEIAANEAGGTNLRTGKYVASGGLFLVNATTGASKRLTSGVDSDPAWSPDGKWIAFDRGDGSPPLAGQGLYVIRTNGTGLRLLSAGFASTPAWSPDGKQIAFDLWAERDWDGGNTQWRHVTTALAVVSPSGTGLRRLTTHSWTQPVQGADDQSPIWSPDGSMIAFQRTIGAGDKGGSFVYLIKPNGIGLRQVTPSGYFAEPTGWSPDSTQLADWRSKICSGCSSDGPAKAWITDVASGASSSFTYPSVRWSPSGKLVAFGCGAAPSGVCVITVDGTVLQTIAAAAAPPPSESLVGIVVDSQTALSGRTHTYDIGKLATDSRTGEPVHGVKVVKILAISMGKATQIGSTSIRYTAPAGINNKIARIRFLATYPGGSAPIPGLFTLLVLNP